MRKAVACIMLAGMGVVGFAGPAAAGEPAFQISPQSGAPGTTIHATDTLGECDGNSAQVTLDLVPASGPAAASTTIVPNSDGTWATDLTVPASTAAGSYSVTARCDQDDGADSFDYQPQSFTVTGAVTTTTTTTTAPTTTTTTVAVVGTTTPTTAAPVAPAATAVTASPALTG